MSKKFINIDELLVRLPDDLPYKGSVKRVLMQAPAADVVDVRHGTWHRGTTESGSVYAECSACGRKMNYSCYGYAYCSLCGAKMDGKRGEGK